MALNPIAPPHLQSARAEKSVAKFLQAADLLEAVSMGEDFHLRIENEPYIPLVVERHGDELYFTHYLSQNGDTFIDAEMVFGIRADGRLQLKEVATQNPFQGGESRGYDRAFAQVFARNIVEQGFAEAARSQPVAIQLDEQPEFAFEQAPDQEGFYTNPTAVEIPAERELEGAIAQADEPDLMESIDSLDSEAPATLFALHAGESELPVAEHPALDPVWKELEKQVQLQQDSLEVSPQPALQDLRTWYRQARDIGRSDQHLMKIEQIGKAFAQGQPLGDRDLTAMERDQAKWQEQVWAIANHAKAILASLGEPLAGGMYFEGKKDYTLFSRDETLYALASGRGVQPTAEDKVNLPQQILMNGRGIIMKLEQGTIYSKATRVTSADAERFQQFAKLVETKLHKQNRFVLASCEQLDKSRRVEGETREISR